MKFFFISLSILAALLLTTFIVQAQPVLPGAPAQAPVDGGLGLLAAAGGAYALKKLRDQKKAFDKENI